MKNELFKAVHVTTASKTGKLQGIDSVNTSTLQNEFCTKMRVISNAICKSCYSASTSKRYATLETKLIYNSELLSNGVLIDYQLPRFNSLYIRFDSFGELINEFHFINLIRICELNPYTTFGLWTKKISLVQRLLDLQVIKKPANLILIASSPVINKEVSLPRHFDKTFTVWDKKTALNQQANINCGGKKCIDCLICYTKNDILNVNELRR